MLTYEITAAASSDASHPFSFKNTHLPLLSVADFVLSQRVGVQVADLYLRKILGEVSVRHPKLAIVINSQADFLLLLLGNDPPLLGPSRKYPINKTYKKQI
jgi:hypothetical protein